MISVVMKKMVFDTKAVTSRVDRSERRVLSKVGWSLRRTAKRSIVKRKAISEPGKPPSSHTGLLRKFIFFGYDRSRGSVVIGPTRLNRTIGNVPEALEYGGTSTTRVGRRRRGRRRRIKIAARPFMGPAFEKEKPGVAAMWANSVR
jgi:hypothetical protein